MSWHSGPLSLGNVAVDLSCLALKFPAGEQTSEELHVPGEACCDVPPPTV